MVIHLASDPSASKVMSVLTLSRARGFRGELNIPTLHTYAWHAFKTGVQQKVECAIRIYRPGPKAMVLKRKIYAGQGKRVRCWLCVATRRHG